MSIDISINAMIIPQNKPTDKEIREKIEEHKKWLADKKVGKCADFSGLNLEGRDFHGLDLSGADFSEAYAEKADFKGAKLTGAKMIGIIAGRADFSNADLCKAEMMRSRLTSASFEGADLSRANLFASTLWDSNMKGANLSSACLISAHLGDCDLTGATAEKTNFSFADLDYTHFTNANCKGSRFIKCPNACYAAFTGADLTGADLTGSLIDLENKKIIGAYVSMSCPDEGSFIAWIACRKGKIAKFLIPEDAKRRAVTDKLSCADKATVLSIYDADGNECDEAVDEVFERYVYRKGETIIPDDGVYFYVTRREAENKRHDEAEEE